MKKLSRSSTVLLVLITLLAAAISFGFFYLIASKGIAFCTYETKPVYDSVGNFISVELSVIPYYPAVIGFSAITTLLVLSLGYHLLSAGTEEVVEQMARIVRSIEEDDGDDDDSFLESMILGHIVHETLWPKDR